MDDFITRLDWDTDFFGFPVARLNDADPTPETIAVADSWCAQKGIVCLYALIPAAKPRTIQRLIAAGYRWVDIRVTLRADPLPSVPPVDQSVRLAETRDVPQLRRIAAESHRDSRFYADPGFPRQKCDEFYAQWIENSVNGYEHAVWVADNGREIEGYVTCKILGAGVGQIGLFAVSAPARGRGIGRHLLNAAIQWFAERDCRAVDVVTQGSNVAAQRIYQRHGFVTRDVSVWLHKWFAKT